MMLCLDSGNTRIKWGLHDGTDWRARGALAQGEAAQLAQLVTDWARPQTIRLANVAGAAAEAGIAAALAAWGLPIARIATPAAGGGVRNGYRFPERLGVDRWCALVGAHRWVSGACLVVMAGTATTIDTLDAAGQFSGGLILPGLDLMRRALARDTAALPLAEGAYAPLPRCTEDAIVSGCLEAQAGAIERAWRRLGDPDAPCLLSGGAAPHLAPLLAVPCRLVDNLVLEGLCVPDVAGG